MTRMWSEILEQPQALERCRANNEQALAALAGYLRQADVSQVVIAARGTSDHAAVYGKYVIELLTGIPVSLAASSVFTVYGRALRLKGALVVGISQSGEAADVLEVLRRANECGAVTAAITNAEASPVAREAQYRLNCDAGEERSVAATKTFSAQIYLLALLAARWAGDADQMRELLGVPGFVSRALDAADAVEQIAGRYCFMQECFVLARGVNYAVSLEAALKIQETTYVRAKAFATSDFQHGPIAMLDPNIPVIAFAPEGPALGDLTGMLERLRGERIDTLVVSNSAEARALGTCGIPIPAVANDMVSPFANAAVAQMFACKLAAVKGLDPDSPRGLHKVTITK